MAMWPAPNKFWIADQCGYPWSPMRPQWPKRHYEPNDAARLGSAFHEMAQVVVAWITEDDGTVKQGIIPCAVSVAPFVEKFDLTEGAGVKLSAMHQYWVEELNLYLEKGRYSAIWPEQAIIFDMADGTARLADRSKNEHFKPPIGCIAQTIDFVAIRDNHLVARDYKTGWGMLEAPPERHWQLRFSGLTSARLHGATRVQIELADFYDDKKPRIQVGRFDDSNFMDAFELQVVHAEVKDLIRRIDSTTEPNPGPACQRCPVLQTCPITTDALARIKEDGENAEPLWTGEFRDKAHASAVHRRLLMVEQTAKRIRQQLTWYAKENNGFETTPGYWYGPVEVAGSRKIDISSPKSIEILRAHLKPEALKIAVDTSTTFEALKRAVAASGGDPGEAKTSDYTKLIGALAEANAISRGASYTKIDEYRIKPAKKSKETKQPSLFGDTHGDEDE